MAFRGKGWQWTRRVGLAAPAGGRGCLCSKVAAGTQAGAGGRLLRALADLLFPPRCLSCGAALERGEPPLLCPDCLAGVLRIEPPLCSCCGSPFPAATTSAATTSAATTSAAATGRLCAECLRDPPAFALARSPLRYEGPAREGLIALKFHGDFTWAATLAALCRESALMADFSPPDVLVPAPLHRERLRSRGFNQALDLARVCFPEWRDRIRPDLLLRRRATLPQTRLDGAARRKNPVGAFAVASGADVAGRTVLLADDVFTTGATVRACARALMDAGCSRVEVFTAARSVKRG